MIKLPKRDKYTVGIMTGSFHTDYSYRIADAVCDALSQADSEFHVVLMQSLDAKRYLSLNSTVDESFDRHYYSMFEYGKYFKPDLLIVSFGTISAVTSSMSTEEFFAPFAGVPAIVLEDDSPVENGIYITVDNYRGMYDCVEHMISNHGYRKILFVSGPNSVPDAQLRYQAYCDCMRDNNIYVSPDMIAYGDFTDQVDDLIEDLLHRNPDAEAICCANDEMAESAYRVIETHGLTVGKDIAVTGFDDIEGSKYMNPPLSTVRQDFSKVADSVGIALKKLINGEDVSSVTIPAEFIVRESCGCSPHLADEILDTRSNEKVIADRARIKKMQQRSIVSSLLLRDLMSKGLTHKNYFERVGRLLSDVGTEKAFICLADKPISLGDTHGYFLPDKLNLYLTVYGDKVDARGFGDDTTADTETMSSLLYKQANKNKQIAIFPLFYQNYHYGALFVELDREDMLFYYTLSLEMGTGINFMLIQLENQAAHRTLEEQNRILDYSARHDDLTDCLTRIETISKANEIIQESGSGGFVVVMADLDYIKHINDTFGHHEGDACIKKTADILKSAMPESCIIGRADGDEFICFFRDDSSYGAEDFINAVKQKCVEYNETSDKPYYLDISMGYHCFDASDAEDFDTIFRKADAKLHIDKKTRRRSVIKKVGFTTLNSDAELSRYIRQTEEIRRLSVPQISDIEGTDSYRDALLNNYKQISEYAIDNIAILHNHFYPLLDYSGDLNSQDIKTMRNFSRALINAYNINNLDGPLAYQQALRLLREAEKTQDDEKLIIALDEMVSASYIMLSSTSRLLPVSDICMEYANRGLDASEKLLTYLEKDKFAKLSDESKEMVLINARYIRVVSQIDGVSGREEDNALLLSRMKNALAIMLDPFYREQAPKYDWEMHEFRILEYICSLTDYNNEMGYKGDDLIFINECTKRINQLYESAERFRSAHNTKDIDIYTCRNAYFAGEISLEDYKNRLEHITFSDCREDPESDVQLVMLHAPLEYMLLLDKNKISDRDTAFLARFYNLLISYMYQTPKKGLLTFLLTYLSLILKNFIELPGIMDFETMGLNLIASLHPPTYVHTLSVANYTVCLTRHLLKKHPQLFIGMPGMASEDDVRMNAKEIEDFAYHAALCHDFGKLAIIEAIITYGRDLLDDEINSIRAHQSIGAYLLSLFPGTAAYADIAKGHHKWYDNKGGYPDDFNLYASPYRTIIFLVACADCLDAATDTVGRSYKTGKSLDELIDEFKSDSGIRYAPFVVDLFFDEEVREEIKEILENERDKSYVETYMILGNHEIGPSSQIPDSD